MWTGSAVVTAVLFIVALIVVVKAIRVVPQQHAWIVERLGRFYAVLEPGLNFVIPFVDRIAYRHDLREIVRRVVEMTQLLAERKGGHEPDPGEIEDTALATFAYDDQGRPINPPRG